MPATVTSTWELDTKGAYRQVEKFAKDADLLMSRAFLSGSSFSNPLGHISSKASEFSKSMDAANARVVAFGASAGLIFAVKRAFDAMLSSTVQVNKSLVEINTVLNLSSQSLSKFSGELFSIAKNTGQSFKDVADGALELARQGLDTAETLKRIRDSAILARQSGLSLTESLESLTAAVNSFGKSALDTTQIINKFANVDQQFAVSSKDLAEAIKRVGSTAEDAGVSIDQLIGLVTTAQQTTARGGAVIGNALKTILTRIERPEVLNQLKEAGIAIQDLQGSALSSIDVLKNFAGAYGQLADAQQSTLAEVVGSVYQINILKSLLGDVAKGYGVFARSTEIAGTAQEESIARNEEYNKSLDAIIKKTRVSFTQLGSSIGDLSIAPVIEKFGKAIEIVIGAGEGQGDSLGSVFGKGILRGIGDFLSGPGLALLALTIGKLASNFTKFTASAAKDFFNVNAAVKEQVDLQIRLQDILLHFPQIQKDIISGERTQLRLQQELLAAAQQRLNAEARISEFLKGSSSAFIRTGALKIDPSTGNAKFNGKAGGFIPPGIDKGSAVAEIVGALKAGYSPGDLRTLELKGIGKVVYNSAETVKTFPGLDQPAIIPPQASQAGLEYKKNFKSTHGFNPYAAEGVIPNFSFRDVYRGFMRNSETFGLHGDRRPESRSLSEEIIRNLNKRDYGRDFLYNTIQGAGHLPGFTYSTSTDEKIARTFASNDDDVASAKIRILSERGNERLKKRFYKQGKDSSYNDYLINLASRKPFGVQRGKDFSSEQEVRALDPYKLVNFRLNGFVPNFNLLNALRREKSAGIPESLIRIGQDNRLTSPQNPKGIGVYNKIDEPLGLGQGIERVAAMGFDPKSAGTYSKGNVPNFADNPFPFLPDRFRNKPPQPPEATYGFTNPLTNQGQKPEFATELERLKKAVRAGALSQESVNSIIKSLEKEYALSKQEVGNINRSLAAVRQNQAKKQQESNAQQANSQSISDVAKAGRTENFVKQAKDKAYEANIAREQEVANEKEKQDLKIRRAALIGRPVGLANVVSSDLFSGAPAGQKSFFPAGNQGELFGQFTTKEFDKDQLASLNSYGEAEKAKRLQKEAYDELNGPANRPYAQPFQKFSSYEQTLKFDDLKRRREKLANEQLEQLNSPANYQTRASDPSRSKLFQNLNGGNTILSESFNFKNDKINGLGGGQAINSLLQNAIKNISETGKVGENGVKFNKILEDNIKTLGGTNEDLKNARRIFQDTSGFAAQQYKTQKSILASQALREASEKKLADRISELQKQAGSAFGGFTPTGRKAIKELQALDAQSGTSLASDAKNARFNKFQDRALITSIAAPIVGGIIQEGIGDKSPGSRGSQAIVGGLTNAVSFGALGAQFGGPIGAGIAASVAALGSLPGIFNAFTGELPELIKKFEDIREQSGKTSNAIDNYISTTEKLAGIYGGLTSVTKGTLEKLKRDQQDSLSVLDFRQRDKILEASKSGDLNDIRNAGSKIKEIQAQDLLQQQAFLSATRIAESTGFLSKALGGQALKRTLNKQEYELIESVPFESEVPQDSGLDAKKKRQKRIDDLRQSKKALTTIELERDDFKEFVALRSSIALTRSTKTGQSIFDTIGGNSEESSKLEKIIKQIPNQITEANASTVSGDLRTEFIYALDDVLKKTGVDDFNRDNITKGITSIEGEKGAIVIAELAKLLSKDNATKNSEAFDQTAIIKRAKEINNFADRLNEASIRISLFSKNFENANQRILAGADFNNQVGQTKREGFIDFLEPTTGPNTIAALKSQASIQDIRANASKDRLGAGLSFQNGVVKSIADGVDSYFGGQLSRVETGEQKIPVADLFASATNFNRTLGLDKILNNSVPGDVESTRKDLEAVLQNISKQRGFLRAEDSPDTSQQNKLALLTNIESPLRASLDNLKNSIDAANDSEEQSRAIQEILAKSVQDQINQQKRINFGGGIEGAIGGRDRINSFSGSIQSIAAGRFAGDNSRTLKGLVGAEEEFDSLGVKGVFKDEIISGIEKSLKERVGAANAPGLDFRAIATDQYEARFKPEKAQEELIESLKSLGGKVDVNAPLISSLTQLKLSIDDLISVTSGKKDDKKAKPFIEREGFKYVEPKLQSPDQNPYAFKLSNYPDTREKKSNIFDYIGEKIANIPVPSNFLDKVQAFGQLQKDRKDIGDSDRAKAAQENAAKRTKAIEKGAGEGDFRALFDFQAQLQAKEFESNRRAGLVDSGSDNLTKISQVAKDENQQRELSSKIIDSSVKILKDFNAGLIDSVQANQRLANSFDKLKVKTDYQNKQIFSDEHASRQLGIRENGIRSGEINGSNVIQEGTAQFLDEFKYDNQDLFKDIIEGASSAAKSIKSSFSDAFASFRDGTKTGKEAFRDFGLSILNRLSTIVSDIAFNQLFGLLARGAGAAISGISPSFASAIQGKADGGYIKRYARGGIVKGGTGVKDDVPALLTSGEFVIKKASVNKYGKNLLDELNEGSVNKTFSNTYQFNNKSRPTAGRYNIDPELSAFALQDENNPQNALREERVETLRGYLKDKAAFDEANRQRLKEFHRGQKQRLIAAYIAAGVGVATAGIGAGLGKAGAAASKSSSLAQGYNGFTSSASPSLDTYYSNKVGFQPQGYYSQTGGLKYASGGSIYSKTSKDSVPALLTGGEYIINKETVNRHGKEFFNKVNAGQYRKSDIKGYAEGGYVPSPTNIPNNSPNSSPQAVGGSTNNITITVNVDKSGKASEDSKGQEGDLESNKKMAASLKRAIIKVIEDEQKPNGRLENTKKR